MITLQDIRAARERVAGIINRTYLDHSATFSRLCGNQVFLKPENLQKTGAFKIRGAANHILQLDPQRARGGVITPSSGNHGQAVAYAASRAGFPAVVVVPEDASPAKVAAIRGYGAEVIFCGTTSLERIEKARELARERGMAFVHSFDDPWVMAGQGTIGLEILEDLPDVDAVLVPIGGGGLISGIATAIKESRPGVKVFGVEPAGSNSMYLSCRAGQVTELKGVNTLADGLRTSKPGELTFPVVQKYVDDILLVEEEEIKAALVTLLERGKLLAEPSGAVTVAALLAGKVPLQGKKVVAVISGGNVDLKLVARLLEEGSEKG